MHNYEFGAAGGSGGENPYTEPENHGSRKNSMFSLIVMIVVIAVIAAVALTITFWALGFLFHLAGWILKVAVLAAVAAFVWRWVNRRWSRHQL
jgi:hypothetical protein